MIVLERGGTMNIELRFVLEFGMGVVGLWERMITLPFCGYAVFYKLDQESMQARPSIFKYVHITTAFAAHHAAYFLVHMCADTAGQIRV
jgi:hypothetical protein